MLSSRIKAAAIVLAASAGLAGCAYGPYVGVSVGTGYGSPYGYGYDPYYSGYGYGYGSPYYSGYGYGYGSPYYDSYYGWNNGFYYPGTGWYVYDRDRHRRPMTDEEKSFWETRIQAWRKRHGTTGQVSESWAGFDKQTVAGSTSAAATGTARADRDSVRQIIETRRAAQIEQRQQREQVRSEARASSVERQQARQESFSARMQERRESRASRKSTDD